MDRTAAHTLFLHARLLARCSTPGRRSPTHRRAYALALIVTVPPAPPRFTLDPVSVATYVPHRGRSYIVCMSASSKCSYRLPPAHRLISPLALRPPPTIAFDSDIALDIDQRRIFSFYRLRHRIYPHPSRLSHPPATCFLRLTLDELVRSPCSPQTLPGLRHIKLEPTARDISWVASRKSWRVGSTRELDRS